MRRYRRTMIGSPVLATLRTAMPRVSRRCVIATSCSPSVFRTCTSQQSLLLPATVPAGVSEEGVAAEDPGNLTSAIAPASW